MRIVDTVWEQLFNRHNIQNNVNTNGFYVITSAQINEFYEARLVTKFDHHVNLPRIFRDNQISILPLTRGSYVLGNFDTYQDINYDANIENINCSLPAHIESIDYNNLFSESTSLNCAYLSGIINDVAGEDTLPTVSGRMSSGQFDFNIRNVLRGNTYPIRITNSQVEIDGGYESLNKLVLVEAKNFTSDDFLIRQLYYPYRLWQSKVNKEVVPVFLTYSNDVFSFFIYRFVDVSEYNSLELVEQRNYIIAPEVITLDDIYLVLQSVQIVQEPQVPFPQADTFTRVVDLLGLLMEHEELTSDYITTNYAFDSRQTSYYTSAAMYLGLVEKRREGHTVYYYLSDYGKQIMTKRHKQKSLALVEAILKHEVFNKVLREYFNTASPVPRNEISNIMNTCFLYNVATQSTVHRRAQTVFKWIEWILSLQS